LAGNHLLYAVLLESHVCIDVISKHICIFNPLMIFDEKMKRTYGTGGQSTNRDTILAKDLIDPTIDNHAVGFHLCELTIVCFMIHV